MTRVYHTATQEDFNALMRELEEQGYRWWNRHKPTADVYLWGAYEERTCINLREDKSLTFAPYRCFKEIGYKITEYNAPQKEKKAMKLEDVFTSECDSNRNIWGSQKFCTKAMKDKQQIYHEALVLESRARNIRQRVLEDLEKAVAEERKALLENVEQLDKALKESEE